MAIYQLRVEVHNAESPQWRRLLVPASITLHDLNEVVQTAMGLYEYRFYSFTIHRRDSYGPKHDPEVEPFDRDFDDRDVTLALALPRPNVRMNHMVDPRDDLSHDIILQKIVPAKPGVQYPHCAAGVDDGEKVDPASVTRALAELELPSLSAKPPSAAEVAQRRIDHRRLEGAKSASLLRAQLFFLTETVTERPALAVRNAGILLEDTAWAVLAAHGVEPADGSDLSALLDEAARLAGVDTDLSAGPTTPAGVLGVSPDLATLHEGVRDGDARSAVEAAFVWCKPLVDTLT